MVALVLASIGVLRSAPYTVPIAWTSMMGLWTTTTGRATINMSAQLGLFNHPKEKWTTKSTESTKQWGLQLFILFLNLHPSTFNLSSSHLPLRSLWSLWLKSLPIHNPKSSHPLLLCELRVSFLLQLFILHPSSFLQPPLPLRLCAFARGNLHTLATVTADDSALPIHSFQLRVISRKGAKTLSFQEFRNPNISG